MAVSRMVLEWQMVFGPPFTTFPAVIFPRLIVIRLHMTVALRVETTISEIHIEIMNDTWPPAKRYLIPI